MQKPTPHQIWLVTALLAGILLWVVCILLLLDITRQLLDTLRFIVELAQMS